MKKFHELIEPNDHKFYSLNFLVAENKTGQARHDTLVDLSKKAHSEHYNSRDFQTYVFCKHISRVLSRPETLCPGNGLNESL
jgi:hypothetical protein